MFKFINTLARTQGGIEKLEEWKNSLRSVFVENLYLDLGISSCEQV